MSDGAPISSNLHYPTWVFLPRTIPYVYNEFVYSMENTKQVGEVFEEM